MGEATSSHDDTINTPEMNVICNSHRRLLHSSTGQARLEIEESGNGVARIAGNNSRRAVRADAGDSAAWLASQITTLSLTPTTGRWGTTRRARDGALGRQSPRGRRSGRLADGTGRERAFEQQGRRVSDTSVLFLLRPLDLTGTTSRTPLPPPSHPSARSTFHLPRQGRHRITPPVNHPAIIATPSRCRPVAKRLQ